MQAKVQSDTFDPNCQRCVRLRDHLSQVRSEYPEYHARPVPSFGDPEARLLIVGLAPGMHGANRTGRAFTGDYAGVLLYETLHGAGFATHPESTAATDALRLENCRITNAVRCLPPQNKPVGEEINNCNAYLAAELEMLRSRSVVFALGGIAHRAVIRALGLRQKDWVFGHAAEHALSDELTMIDSYHCSRYNTNTRRLTEEMFVSVMQRARVLVDLATAESAHV